MQRRGHCKASPLFKLAAPRLKERHAGDRKDVTVLLLPRQEGDSSIADYAQASARGEILTCWGYSKKGGCSS